MAIEPITASVVLGWIAGKVTDALAKTTEEHIGKLLRGDPAKKAFAKALGGAIARYSVSGGRLYLARPLSEKESPLNQKAVSDELAQILRFDRPPDYGLIGRLWKSSLKAPPTWVDFRSEAQQLIAHLESELRTTDIYRPVFQSKDLLAIRRDTDTSVIHLEEISATLASLGELLDVGFGRLLTAFLSSSVGIRFHIRDSTRLISEKTRDFVGRDFVLGAFDTFVTQHSSGYFVLRGDPGIGKTAFAAELVRSRGYIHHFNVRAEGINTSDAFLSNVCSQLIAAYNLPYEALPPETKGDSGFLSRLLSEIAEKLPPETSAVLIVDAIDEVDDSKAAPGTNALFLPTLLPPNVFILLTIRNVHLSLRTDGPMEILDIAQDDPGNIADIASFVNNVSNRTAIKNYMLAHGLSTDGFVRLLVSKSQGNFMYLKYVIPEIERGAYQDVSVDHLPNGLRNYYEDHWVRMKGQNPADWFAYKLPIVLALTVVREPVSIEMLQEFAAISERSRVRGVLNEWRQFLHEQQCISEGHLERRYRIYHLSFRDFVAEKEEIADECVSFREANAKIADRMWNKIAGT